MMCFHLPASDSALRRFTLSGSDMISHQTLIQTNTKRIIFYKEIIVNRYK